MSIPLSPLNDQQLSALTNLSAGLNHEQVVWLNGYFQGFSVSSSNKQPDVLPITEPISVNLKSSLTILYGTHTGRSKTIAEELSKKLTANGVQVNLVSMDDYKTRQLTGEIYIVIVVSTHGKGEPPVMAEDFHSFITGKRAPRLPKVNYSVIALGDKSYRHFCKTGIEIDQAFSQLGAKTILPVLKLDLDYEDDVKHWINQFLEIITNKQSKAFPANEIQKDSQVAEQYSRKKPFRATVLDKVKITGRDSDKEVFHIELSLEGSGLTYEPGDSIGILANNPPSLVNRILKQARFDENESVNLKEGTYSLKEALSDHIEITVLTLEVLRKYQEKTGNNKLLELIENEEQLDSLLFGNDLLDLLEEFPFEFTAQELVDILRSFPARLYSICSSQSAVGNEVHVAVSTLRYSHLGREREGACSGYLADRIAIDGQIAIFIEKNPSFKLPDNDQTPVILIGTGTGVAPYRAFLQHREANNQKGKTWLFFGERRFHTDFLYQLEWQKLLKDGYLEKIDVAFSRDQDEKFYVQHRLIERQKEVFDWLNKGANIYLCGDMKQMARDVQKTLLRIFESEGGMSEEKALDYLKTLKKEKRFQTDVY